MTTRFYDKAFKDVHLDKFIRSHRDPHGARLGKWIIQKFDPNSSIWDEDLHERPAETVRLAGGRKHEIVDRTSAHVAAWNCIKRPAADVGRRFKLDDCIIWMRLMFWAAREEGLLDKPVFASFFETFLAHFIAVYERSAPPHTHAALLWSKDQRNLDQYLNNGRVMLFD